MKKRLFAIVLAVLIVLPFIASASAADTESTVAVTLKLEAVDGTAAVANKAGKKLTITKSMKLFNGYSVATAAESYAYLNLDNTKAVKMDASSKIELRESGKKLEALLKSGNLFFNVSKPLEEGESLNIRTSTMVAGIRGTSGWVNVIDSKTTEIHMLTGSVELTCTDPVTGEVTTETVSAGEVATLTVEEAAPVNINSDITIEIYTEEVVPGYVAQAIKSDAELQELITEETALSVPVIIGSADEKLA
ncbi:MAG: FecR family protein, partial [Oscillospiraceae bacterium]|nr:FecR family protein [Oscillospiraceae bacterium]